MSEDEFQSGFSDSAFSEQAKTENASQQFEEWDEDGDGYLSQEEFRSGLSEIQGVEQMGEQMGEQQTPPGKETTGEDAPQRAQTGGEMSPGQLFSQWDEDGDGRLGEDEFQSGFSESALSEKPQAETASQYFDEWDEDGNGYLSQEELRSGISELKEGEQMGEQVGERQGPPRGETEEDVSQRAETGGDQPPAQQQTGAAADEVQEFAQRMIEEHSQVIDRAEQLANRLDIQREDNLASQVMSNSVQGLVEQLQDTGGMATMGGDEPAEPQQQQQQQQEMGQQGEMEGQMSDQEREYMMAQVSLHQQALLLLNNTLIPNADESELQQMLEKERETIKQHLEEAKQILTGQSQGAGSMGEPGDMNN